MKQFNIKVGNRKFHFEFEDGRLWLRNEKNSYSNDFQMRDITFTEVKEVAPRMLRGMGRISKSEYMSLLNQTLR